MTEIVRMPSDVEAFDQQASGFEGASLPIDAYVRAPEGGLAPPMARRRLRVLAAMIVADIAILLGCFYLVGLGYLVGFRGQPMGIAAMLPANLLLPLFLTIALYNGSYSGEALTDWKQAARRAILALVISAAFFNFFIFFAKMSDDFSRVAFALSILMTSVLLIFSRLAVVRWVRRQWVNGPTNRLLIMAGGPEVTLPGTYTVDAGKNGISPKLDDPQSLHLLAMYLRNMEEVLVSCPESDRAAWSQVLKGSGVHCEVVSTMASEIGALGLRHYSKAKFSSLVIASGALRLRDRALKRAFDIVASTAALFLMSPLMLFTAVAIKLEDGGPVFFRQMRVGRGNHFFPITKFRSMKATKLDADGVQSATKDDRRLTQIGRIIRRTSIDELPQLFNVLNGDMSIVGPRPHALGSRAGDKLFWQIDRRYWLRHTLRPGITGLAQVRGYRGATDSEDDLANRLQSDLEYLNDWNLWRDLGIIASTLRVLVHDRAF